MMQSTNLRLTKVSLDTVPNIKERVDVRALAAYADAKGINKLDVTPEERKRFIITD